MAAAAAGIGDGSMSNRIEFSHHARALTEKAGGAAVVVWNTTATRNSVDKVVIVDLILQQNQLQRRGQI